MDSRKGPLRDALQKNSLLDLALFSRHGLSVLNRVLSLAEQMLVGYQANITLFHEGQVWYYTDENCELVTVEQSRSLSASVLESSKPFVVSDTQKLLNSQLSGDWYEIDQGVAVFAATGIPAPNGEIIAALNISKSIQSAEPSGKEIVALVELGSVLEMGLRAIHSICLENEKRKLTVMAETDALTQLPNRIALERYLDGYFSKIKSAGALLLIDLNGFKHVNDKFGHVWGDKVLRLAAKRIRNAVRENDFFARIGGDEFVVVTRSQNRLELKMLCERVISEVSEEFVLEAGRVTIGASIGICHFTYPLLDQQCLISCADKAMYRAKHGKTGYEFYFN